MARKSRRVNFLTSLLKDAGRRGKITIIVNLACVKHMKNYMSVSMKRSVIQSLSLSPTILTISQQNDRKENLKANRTLKNIFFSEERRKSRRQWVRSTWLQILKQADVKLSVQKFSNIIMSTTIAFSNVHCRALLKTWLFLNISLKKHNTFLPLYNTQSFTLTFFCDQYFFVLACYDSWVFLMYS